MPYPILISSSTSPAKTQLSAAPGARCPHLGDGLSTCTPTFWGAGLSSTGPWAGAEAAQVGQETPTQPAGRGLPSDGANFFQLLLCKSSCSHSAPRCCRPPRYSLGLLARGTQPHARSMGTARAPGGWGLVIGAVIAVSNDTLSWLPLEHPPKKARSVQLSSGRGVGGRSPTAAAELLWGN